MDMPEQHLHRRLQRILMAFFLLAALFLVGVYVAAPSIYTHTLLLTLSSPERYPAAATLLLVGLGVFPPATMHQKPWYLHPGGGLASMVPPPSGQDHYRYDPADPTPSVGGVARSFGTGAGSQDNRALEVRPDVLTYTSVPFEWDMEVIGSVSAALFVRSSLSHTDFFVRNTDVERRAASMNVGDGLLRLAPCRPARGLDSRLKVKVELWPMAYRFRRGHAIRVHVSSGAFSRWARNQGSGEPLATATTLREASQQVYHDPAHPSAVVLPFLDECLVDQEFEAR